MKKHVSTDEIVAMHKAGMTQEDIGKAVGMSNQGVSYRLRRAGIFSGKGKHDPNKGGMIADTIPEVEFKVPDEVVMTEEVQKMAEKNAANACLVVGDSVITLEGQVGSYEVSRKKRTVFVNINGDEIEMSFEQVKTIVDEFRALARGLINMDTATPEMW